MKSFFSKHKRILAEIGITLLALLCIASLWYFVDSFTAIYRTGDLRPEARHEQIQPGAIPVSSWMTFNYLNVVFKLPPAYLQKQLNITDSHYPNIRIDTYSKRNHLDSQAFLLSVQEAIQQYQPAAY